MKRTSLVFAAAFAVMAIATGAGQQSGSAMLTADLTKNLTFRSIGPTLSTGRVADITVDPNHPDVYYVASAVGGLWKSDNRGTRGTPYSTTAARSTCAA